MALMAEIKRTGSNVTVCCREGEIELTFLTESTITPTSIQLTYQEAQEIMTVFTKVKDVQSMMQAGLLPSKSLLKP